MTEAERHEFQLRRMSLVLGEYGEHGRVAAKVLQDAADFIQRHAEAGSFDPAQPLDSSSNHEDKVSAIHPADSGTNRQAQEAPGL